MKRFSSPDAAARWCRESDRSLGFVPTMGALHAGHLALVRRAASENERVCVSIFVNPLQFDDPTDLERYPRDFEGDAALLTAGGADAVFTGSMDDFFPGAHGAPPRLDPGPAAEGLEGLTRTGHFAGVATIVDRLFAVVEPRRAYFGEKDFQQTLVVRDLARRRGGPEIVVCPTVRESDGLARSSRNAQLDAPARSRALGLGRALAAAHAAWGGGERDPAALSGSMQSALGATLAAPDQLVYAEVRDPAAWSATRPVGPLARAQALVAAHVGTVRLIDNLRLDGPLPAELGGCLPAELGGGS